MADQSILKSAVLPASPMPLLAPQSGAALPFGRVGHTAWAPEGRKGRSQAGPKGRKLDVGAQRAPRILVI